MQVLVYHQNAPFNPALLLINNNCKVRVYADKLTKVATISFNGSNSPGLLPQAFLLTQHLENPWYFNPSVSCHCDSARSTSTSDIFYLVETQQWYMVAPVGWWQEGDRWRFEGNPPAVELAPRPYDAVLGTGVNLIPGLMVLSPNQGKCKSRSERHTLTHVDCERQKWAIAYIPIRGGWRVEVRSEELHYWGTKVFSNPIAAEQDTVAAINQAVKECIEQEEYDAPLLTMEAGFIDTAEEGVDSKINHEFYRDWFIYTNYEYELALYDPLTNECHEFPYEGTLEEAIVGAKLFIDSIEYERHVPPSQLALFELESF